jgi:hypothetical protein
VVGTAVAGAFINGFQNHTFQWCNSNHIAMILPKTKAYSVGCIPINMKWMIL